MLEDVVVAAKRIPLARRRVGHREGAPLREEFRRPRRRPGDRRSKGGPGDEQVPAAFWERKGREGEGGGVVAMAARRRRKVGAAVAKTGAKKSSSIDANGLGKRGSARKHSSRFVLWLVESDRCSSTYREYAPIVRSIRCDRARTMRLRDARYVSQSSWARTGAVRASGLAPTSGVPLDASIEGSCGWGACRGRGRKGGMGMKEGWGRRGKVPRRFRGGKAGTAVGGSKGVRVSGSSARGRKSVPRGRAGSSRAPSVGDERSRAAGQTRRLYLASGRSSTLRLDRRSTK
ncbi:hypothetical protein KM043_008824 [Ampulex compressa]|nr:hypothetical protein KM043_008824 [Ampulex compressa]